ncbi:MAG: hypothetical protein Q8M03_06330, partial [Legionella sp.]|nr:hypothetical protein [Legionella sp.]
MADDKNGPARGFGALGEWVSDVDKDLEGLEKPAPQVMTTARPVGGSVSGAKPASPASAGRSPARNGTDLLKRIGIGIGLWTGTILL